jgi:hypothetical protein
LTKSVSTSKRKKLGESLGTLGVNNFPALEIMLQSEKSRKLRKSNMSFVTSSRRSEFRAGSF